MVLKMVAKMGACKKGVCEPCDPFEREIHWACCREKHYSHFENSCCPCR